MIEEASAVENWVRSVSNFFNPQEQGPTEEELAAAERRKAAGRRTEQALSPLRLSVLTGTDEEDQPIRQVAPVKVLQSLGKQNLAVFMALNEEALTDIILSMRIKSREFSERNLLVVPVLFDLQSRTFIELSPRVRASKLMNQASVALPAVTGEDSYRVGKFLAFEFSQAENEKMGDEAKRDGIALLMRPNGEIARRLVGRPDWDKVFIALDL